MEVMYATLMGIKTIGVSNSYSLDPWYHYHLDNIIKPASVLPQLGEFLEFTAAIEDRLTEGSTSSIDDYEPFEDVGFGD
ncbi:MAG: hypothetical protein DRJ15_16270 [Bacteroidetes bacterium]|nr:MAG: hypothetical protein DRJ15_16270 [Bacteroidota bacterium]